MINKKQIIKHYLQETEATHTCDNETTLKIAQIAARYHIPFFENEALRARLLNCDAVDKLSQNERQTITMLLKFFVHIEKEAQLSK
ncbi:hypothetical protein [Sulfurospirillum sp. 1612]|uniref:hypothetical protein n=1 Tax=Sulfurospirillum sp. 1612 TaxID=3094835 RepID=UPI002F92B84D